MVLPRESTPWLSATLVPDSRYHHIVADGENVMVLLWSGDSRVPFCSPGTPLRSRPGNENHLARNLSRFPADGCLLEGFLADAEPHYAVQAAILLVPLHEVPPPKESMKSPRRIAARREHTAYLGICIYPEN
jgi:hypothetical protein